MGWHRQGCGCEARVNPPGLTYSEAEQLLLEGMKAKRKARQANRELADALEALPQLFIAV